MSSPSRRSSFRLPPELRGPLLAGCLLFVASWAFVSFAPWFSRWLYGDVRFYENWANMVTNHQVPYRDFRIEYPPLALVPSERSSGDGSIPRSSSFYRGPSGAQYPFSGSLAVMRDIVVSRNERCKSGYRPPR